jgi:outer membrane protein assembly factor BamB
MRCFLIAVVAGLVGTGVAAADNWPQWRGPSGSGVAPEGEYPTRWSTTENIRWKVTLPGPGSSTPIVWEDKIFVTCGVGGSRSQPGDNVVLCLDRAGNKLWQTTVGQERPGKNQKATGSNSSVATDGRLAYAYFKSGDLACLDFAGKIVWHHNLQSVHGPDQLLWDLGTSPVLTKDFVVVAVMHAGPSYLVAYERETGKQAWKVDRNVRAPGESRDSYTTPLVVEEGGRELVIVLGADHLTAHDAASGREVWRVEGFNPGEARNWRSISSPVYADGIVVAPYARGELLTAVRIGGASGNVTDTHIVWELDNMAADVPTPAIADGKVYVCRDGRNRGEVVCLDLQTGRTLLSANLGRGRHQFSSSPILAGGKLYITDEGGQTTVLDPADDLKVLATNDIGGEQTVATPAFVDGQILLRTRESLFCIGK